MAKWARIVQVTEFITLSEAICTVMKTREFTPYLLPRIEKNGSRHKLEFAVVRMVKPGDGTPLGNIQKCTEATLIEVSI